MPTFKARNGKWLSITKDAGDHEDQGGPSVTASRSDDPDKIDDLTTSDFHFLPARSELWWSITAHRDRPVLMSGTELQIFAPPPGLNVFGARLLVMSERLPGLHAQLMDSRVRGGGNILPFDSMFTIQKVDVVDPAIPGGKITRTPTEGPIRNGDSVALRVSNGSYLEIKKASGVVTRGASTVRKNAVFTFQSRSDLAVRLAFHRALNGSVSAIYLSVEDGYTRVPIPATFDLVGSPFGVKGLFDANTWIDSTFEWGTAPASASAWISLRRIDRRPTDPWRPKEILRFRRNEAASWALGRDGATTELWV